MANETVVYTPDNNGGSVPAWLAMNNGGFGNGLGGWGGGILGFFLGLLFGNGWNGFGGFGGFGGGNGAGFLSNQIDNNAGRELLMNAINSNGEASRAAIGNLATALGQDFNLVNSAVQTLQNGLSNLALQQAVSVPQIINSIQAGNADMALQLCKCCCDQRQLTVEQGYQNQLATLNQTNQLGNAISGSGQRTVDAIADLKTTMVKEFCDVKEREMQSKIDTQAEIITQLRNEADNARQTNQIAAMISPIAREVDDIKCKLPNTVSVNWPNLMAVNTTPYVSGGFYQGGFNNGGNYFGPGWGFGFNNGFGF